MNFRFDFTKTLQAAGVLLEFEKTRRMSYLRLLKLLYVADRESLAEAGRPITGDRAVAMKHGPVLTHVYDLIRGLTPRAGDWDSFIHKEDYSVQLVGEPGRGQLCRQEVKKLQEISERYRALDDWQLVDELHKLQEWRDSYKEDTASFPIPWERVLEAQGKADLIEEVANDERARATLAQLFRG